jgi:hypothetical protein
VPLVPLAGACWFANRYQPAPWCWCTHDKKFHTHDRTGTDCAKCPCKYFQAPFIRRTP